MRHHSRRALAVFAISLLTTLVAIPVSPRSTPKTGHRSTPQNRP